ncbi:MAG: nucleotidyltransferase domain-containing protein [Deltaproteobacteria bacterium]|nr:nucleotidyltransferase domain-containing protein [Deltaproteobacteria bacterium]
MKDIGLTPHELDLIREVFRRFPVISEVTLYGSRTKGTYRPESDIDLALVGVDDDVQAEAVADQLDELLLPYRFDVKAYIGIKYGPLRKHIARVGVSLYRRVPSDQLEPQHSTPPT